jgi:starvation-inducible DNA-binding protein
MSGQRLSIQKSPRIPDFATVDQVAIALFYRARTYSCPCISQLRVDSPFLYALYEQRHCLTHGATFYPFHPLPDRHARPQLAPIGDVAGRVPYVGDVAVGSLQAAATSISRPLDGVEEIPALPSRLPEPHETMASDAEDAVVRTGEQWDDGAQELPVPQVIRAGECRGWFLAEHLVETPLMQS